MEDIVIKVANGLGWSHRYDWSCLEVAIPDMGGFHTAIRPECNLIYIAAYAKAEMAKRGWVNHISGSVAWAGHTVEGVRTDQFSFNRKCPIAEAEAVLRCVFQALSLSPNPSDQAR